MADRPYNVDRQDCAPHDHLLSPGEELWENHGWCVRGEDRGTEYLLWSGMYLVHGSRYGTFVDGDHRIPQTIFVSGRYSPHEKGQMHDNDFVIWGTHLNGDEYTGPEGLVVRSDPDAGLSWQLGGKEHVSNPPAWAIHGSHGGVELNIALDAYQPAWWVDDVFRSRLRGFQVLARASGFIKTDGVELRVDADAQHEKYHIVSPARGAEDARAAMAGRAQHAWIGAGDHMVWHCGFHPDVKFFLQSAPKPLAEGATPICRVIVRGSALTYDRERVEVHEVKYWTDPRSGFTMPVDYHLVFSSADGLTDLSVTSYARAYYLWDYERYEFSVLYWFMADAQGSFTYPSGEVIPIRDMKYVAHTNRAFLTWQPPAAPSGETGNAG